MKTFKLLTVLLFVFYCAPTLSGDKQSARKPNYTARMLRIGVTGGIAFGAFGGAACYGYNFLRGTADVATGNTYRSTDGTMYGHNVAHLPLKKMLPVDLCLSTITGLLCYKTARSCWNQVKGLKRVNDVYDVKKDNATVVSVAAMLFACCNHFSQKA